jgi:hypothetical protein
LDRIQEQDGEECLRAMSIQGGYGGFLDNVILAKSNEEKDLQYDKSISNAGQDVRIISGG